MSEMRSHSPAGAEPTTFRVGDRGRAVAEIRSRLDLLGLTDGAPRRPARSWTSSTRGLDRAVRAFQQLRGLSVDGVVGVSTYRVLEEARWRLGDRLLTHVAGNLLAGDDVLALQQRLLDLGFKVGKVDGRYGHQTEQAVRDFQRNVGVPPDGTCGPATLKALSRLAPMVRGGSPNAMRAEERIRRDGPAADRQDRGHRPLARPLRRPRPAAAGRRDHHGPRAPHRGPAGRHRGAGLPDQHRRRRRRHRGGARRVRQPHRRRTCASRCRSTARRTPTPAASRRTTTARRRTASRRRSASGSPGWCSARSSRAPTSATCARTRRPGTCCGAPGCRRSASTPATSPTPGRRAALRPGLPRRHRGGGGGRRPAGLPRPRRRRPDRRAAARRAPLGAAPPDRPSGAAAARAPSVDRPTRCDGSAAGCRTGRRAQQPLQRGLDLVAPGPRARARAASAGSAGAAGGS